MNLLAWKTNGGMKQTKMVKYQGTIIIKRQVIVEAFQLTVYNRFDIDNWPNWLQLAWNKEHGKIGSFYNRWPSSTEKGLKPERFCIETAEGRVDVYFNDWILKEEDKDIYCCDVVEFKRVYKIVANSQKQFP